MPCVQPRNERRQTSNAIERRLPKCRHEPNTLQPLGGNQMPRSAGYRRRLRLPGPFRRGAGRLFRRRAARHRHVESSRRALRAAADSRGRAASCRPYNMATRAAPFDSLAGRGHRRRRDQHVRSVKRASTSSKPAYDRDPVARRPRPLTLGGDHTIAHSDPACDEEVSTAQVGLVHVDAHADVNETMFGEAARARHAVPG